MEPLHWNRPVLSMISRLDCCFFVLVFIIDIWIYTAQHLTMWRHRSLSNLDQNSRNNWKPVGANPTESRSVNSELFLSSRSHTSEENKLCGNAMILDAGEVYTVRVHKYLLPCKSPVLIDWHELQHPQVHDPLHLHHTPGGWQMAGVTLILRTKE